MIMHHFDFEQRLPLEHLHQVRLPKSPATLTQAVRCVRPVSILYDVPDSSAPLFPFVSRDQVLRKGDDRGCGLAYIIGAGIRSSALDPGKEMANMTRESYLSRCSRSGGVFKAV